MSGRDLYPKMYLYRRIVQAKMFIDAHYAEKIDVANISGEAAFSKFHFIRLFRQAYGQTPHRYLVQVRIEKAKMLLEQGSSVSDACLAVGFESLGSFSSLFKRTTGKTPVAFREERMNFQRDIRREPLGYIPGCFAGANGWKAEKQF